MPFDDTTWAKPERTKAPYADYDLRLLKELLQRLNCPGAWAQHTLGYGHHRHCLVGWVNEVSPSVTACRRLTRHLAAALPAPFQQSIIPSVKGYRADDHKVVSFNDHQQTTKHMVVRVVRIAMHKLETG